MTVATLIENNLYIWANIGLIAKKSTQLFTSVPKNAADV